MLLLVWVVIVVGLAMGVIVGRGRCLLRALIVRWLVVAMRLVLASLVVAIVWWMLRMVLACHGVLLALIGGGNLGVCPTAIMTMIKGGFLALGSGL